MRRDGGGTRVDSKDRLCGRGYEIIIYRRRDVMKLGDFASLRVALVDLVVLARRLEVHTHRLIPPIPDTDLPTQGRGYVELQVIVLAARLPDFEIVAGVSAVGVATSSLASGDDLQNLLRATRGIWPNQCFYH